MRSGVAGMLLLVYLLGVLTASSFWKLQSQRVEAAQVRLPSSVRQILDANCTKDDLRVAMDYFQRREAWRRARKQPYLTPSSGELSEAIWITQCLVYFAIPN